MSNSRDSVVVAINGLGGLEFLWDGLRAALSPRYELVVLDLPGHGDRPPLPDYHYAALVDDVVERVKPCREFPLLGWSVGAAVAWLLAAQHPQLVTSLVLIEPAAPHQSRFRHGPIPEPVHPFTFAGIDKAIEALRAVDSSVTQTDVVRLYRQNSAGRWEPRFDPAMYAPLVEDARDLGDELGLELAAVRCPVLVVRGERSFLTDAMAQELVSLAPNSTYATVRDAGHFVVKEKPTELGRIISNFLGTRQ